MRLLLLLRGLLVLLLSLGSLSAARASHIYGGDITYAPVASTTAGVPRYHVVLRNFINKNTPFSAIISINLTVAPANCTASGAYTISVPYTQIIGGSPPLCNAPGLSYMVYLYETDVDLPAGQWLLSTSLGLRDASAQNITNASTQTMYFRAYLDNTGGLQNSSPKFESIVLPDLLPSSLSAHSISAFDLEGDSLSYELALPNSSCNQSVSGTTTPHYTVAAGTGALQPTSITTSQQGIFNATVRVNEYRKLASNRWELIGYVVRDMQYMLYPSTNQPPAFTTMRINSGPALSTNPRIAVQRGQTVSVELQATDPDATQLLRFTSEAPSIVPGLSLTRIGTANGVLLTWQVPATLPPGRYAIAVGVLDNGCPLNASEERTLVFVVSANAPLATRGGLGAATEVYPTPFREQVQFKTAPHQVVVLFDALGREVARFSSAADGLVRWQPTSALPAGLYFARSAADGQPLARLLRAE